VRVVLHWLDHGVKIFRVDASTAQSQNRRTFWALC